MPAINDNITDLWAAALNVGLDLNKLCFLLNPPQATVTSLMASPRGRDCHFVGL